eukprot:1331844-Amorphochlora_amoeboformis.AAC.2
MGWIHLVPTLAATNLWALSDICCDACIEEVSEDESAQKRDLGSSEKDSLELQRRNEKNEGEMECFKLETVEIADATLRRRGENGSSGILPEVHPHQKSRTGERAERVERGEKVLRLSGDESRSKRNTRIKRLSPREYMIVSASMAGVAAFVALVSLELLNERKTDSLTWLLGDDDGGFDTLLPLIAVSGSILPVAPLPLTLQPAG